MTLESFLNMDFDFHNNKAQSFGDICVVDAGYEKCPSGHSFGPYRRDYYLIHFVMEGKGKYYFGDKEYTIEKDCGFIIFPEDITTYTADITDPWYYYWVGFNGAKAADLVSSCGFTKENPVFKYDKDIFLKEQIKLLFHQSKKMDFNNLTMTGYLYLFLSSLYRQHKQLVKDRVQDYVDRAIVYIQNHFTKDITVEMIAKNLFISRSYLFRIFKSHLNMSPSEYLQEYRLDKACVLLKQSSHNITDIALYCGFKSVSLFCKAFKKKFSISALKFRNNNITLTSIKEP